MERFTNEMRRARLARRHRLVEPARDPADVVRSLVALHSSDPATVFLTFKTRLTDFETGDLERLLYESKELVRIYGMRRTMWVVDLETLPLVDRSSTNVIAASNRRRLEKIVESGGITDNPQDWLDALLNEVVAEIDRSDGSLARELSSKIPALKTQIPYHNKKGELIGKTGVATASLVQLALESRTIRAKPVGSWISSQYRWARMEDWLGGPIPPVDREEAAAAMVDRYLRQFGPATTTDIKWWTGWTATRTKQALADVGAIEVTLDDGIGWVLEGDIDEPPLDGPSVALLPSLDPTTMGWKEREWYLGDHYPVLFDRNGNAGPTVWIDGAVVGGWAQRKSGEVVYELLDDVDKSNRQLISDKVDELQEWLGDVVITPRFRSPHEKALAAG